MRPLQTFSGPRVGLLIAVLQPGGGHVRVDLGRAQAAVAKQFLHAADIRAAVEQVRGEAVPHRMRAGARIKAGLFEILFEQAADAARGEPATAAVDEYRGGLWL